MTAAVYTGSSRNLDFVVKRELCPLTPPATGEPFANPSSVAPKNYDIYANKEIRYSLQCRICKGLVF